MPIIVSTPAPSTSEAVAAVTSLGDAVWENLPAYIREADDGTAAALVGAFSDPVEAAVAVMADASATADEELTPFTRIGWLAAIAGIDVSTVPDDRKRAIVGDASWRYRGSLDAIRKRVGETLTGSRTVEIITPYLGNVNRIAVSTYAAQTPDPTATEAAIRAEIPAWMRVTIATDLAGQSYTALAADYATYGVMAATSKSYGTLSQEV